MILSNSFFSSLKKIISRALLSLALVSCSLSAYSGGEKTSPTVYAFGVASSLGDTVVYVTAIETLDGATLDASTAFLNDRSHYSRQLESALQSAHGGHFTATLCFSTKRRKVEKQLLALRRRLLRDTTQTMVNLSAEEFSFRLPETASE